MTSGTALTTTATAPPPEHFLVRHIRAHVLKGDKAKDKAEQHYIAAGQHLATLKAVYAPTWAKWESILQTQVGLSPSRASELMQIADGRKTVEQVRADTNRRKLEHRSSSLRNEEPDAHAIAACTGTATAITVGASGLISILAGSNASVRAEAANALISGTRQSEFEAVTGAVSDLYQQLSKAGR